MTPPCSGFGGYNVSACVDRQPRRDRGAHPSCLPGDRGGRGDGVLRRRRGLPPRTAVPQCRVHRPGQGGGQLFECGRPAHRGQGDGVRRHPPRLRLPVGERGLRPAVRRPGPRLHRPLRGGDSGHGQQGGRPGADAEAQRPGGARLGRAGGDRPGRGRDRPENRISGAGEGQRRRRRQRNAPGGSARGACRQIRGGQGGSPGLLWRWAALPGEADPQPQAHRVSDPGRPPRQCDPPGRAGLLHPAEEPEAGGGVPLQGAHPPAAGADGGGRCGRREGRRL